jgi:hypothetical protein
MISKTGERIGALAASVMAVYFAYAAWNFPAGGEQFPLFAAASIVVIAIAMVVRTFVSPDVFKAAFELPRAADAVRPVAITAATIAYVFIIFELGYYTTTLVFLVVMSWLVGVRKPRAIALTAVVMLPLMYAFFELFLQARMPRGILL